ncbi:hypothetical protein GCM10007052_31360 [Halioglobus japonicus]|uniref:Uncharacterized protein n=1 Tax=Halioglobus japonicus TaxID=930805 RepID=A0AAP8MBS7_9GAMM|nr:hypothetical protein C0029_17065 [Halioglobus japonicus]GHD21031.1 hypothetical protein GCM10007052_31360 [Halioglobus japonicus]
MAACDVSDPLGDALSFTGLDQIKVINKPRLLAQYSPLNIASDLSNYLDDRGMDHKRDRPYHPKIQGI